MVGLFDNLACNSFYRFYHGKNLMSNSKKGGVYESCSYDINKVGLMNQTPPDKSTFYNKEGMTLLLKF
jgi:hypothetical protein